MRHVEKMTGPNQTGVWAIRRNDKLVGKLIAKYPSSGDGVLHVNLWDWTEETGSVQYGKASGFGHDKLSAALTGLCFAGITFQDHPNNWKKMLLDNGFEIENFL